ncbi:MAG: UDP-N-acetylmuramoyl-L-alanyl-D-glutamate--2,6-diaminopimelate ligase [Ignavibacteriaceae bacterium]|nr:UDP-N-acetylmuramoyl-L-alanyl-D-glutamate--2,6-diaminopimelate ligase [Ignavibacteriaceae bacterium]
MELTDLINRISISQIVGEVQRQDVTGIYYDSRRVIKGSVFVAIKGFKSDGHKFILDALNNGALAVILEDNNSVPDEIFIHNRKAKIVVKDCRIALAQASNYFFKEPSSKLKLIGITGTNGKTTTTYYLKSIVERAGYKAGLVGTISNYIGDREIKTSLTTPESNDMNELLYQMHSEGCSYAIMEVSSHSLILKRVYGLNFRSAVFTNITSDHLDFHGNLEEYFKAKKILFDNLSDNSDIIYNKDDKNGQDIIKDSKANAYSYGKTQGSDFLIKNISFNLSGTSFVIQYKAKDYLINTMLVGGFNAYNACAAFATAVINGISPEIAAIGIRNTKQVPGRFEVIGKGPKKVIIDYSHTPDSLEKALSALKNIVKEQNPVYTVFGCGGNRDRTKRPVMGKIASEMSNKIFITSDNPRDENPLEIIKEIKAGITKNNFEVIENREEAIKSAIVKTESNAVILVAGKGHESYQEIRGVRNHFSDREIVQKYLAE